LYDRQIDPITQVVITNGASEGGFACAQALVNPGDQVIMFEPFYGAYPAWVSMAGGEPVYVPLRKPTANNTDTIDDTSTSTSTGPDTTTCRSLDTRCEGIGTVHYRYIQNQK
jgi:N-succinyldiaminopimelate aminotransferase